MYYVGIDVSKYKHDCFIVTSDGEVIRESFSFGNDHDGFQTLLSALDPLGDHRHLFHHRIQRLHQIEKQRRGGILHDGCLSEKAV